MGQGIWTERRMDAPLRELAIGLTAAESPI